MIGFVKGILKWTWGIIDDAMSGKKGLEAARAKAAKGYRADETDSDDEFKHWQDGADATDPGE